MICAKSSGVERRIVIAGSPLKFDRFSVKQSYLPGGRMASFLSA
jgi:hypothetical protein